MSSWPSRAQKGEQPDAERGADDAAGEQHAAERNIDGAPPPVADRARHRGCRDMAGDAGHGDRGRDADEDQERRHQEAAADAEHSGDKPDRKPHRQDDEDIDRQIGDGKINLHQRSSFELPTVAGAERVSGQCPDSEAALAQPENVATAGSRIRLQRRAGSRRYGRQRLGQHTSGMSLLAAPARVNCCKLFIEQNEGWQGRV